MHIWKIQVYLQYIFVLTSTIPDYILHTLFSFLAGWSKSIPNSNKYQVVLKMPQQNWLTHAALTTFKNSNKDGNPLVSCRKNRKIRVLTQPSNIMSHVPHPPQKRFKRFALLEKSECLSVPVLLPSKFPKGGPLTSYKWTHVTPRVWD